MPSATTRLAPALLTLLAVAAVGCDRIPGTDEHLVVDAKRAVLMRLQSPQTATFSSILIGHAGDHRIVCGVVHGRVKAPGYGDPVRFMGTESTVNFDPGSPTAAKPDGSQRNLAAPDYLFQDMWRGAQCSPL